MDEPSSPPDAVTIDLDAQAQAGPPSQSIPRGERTEPMLFIRNGYGPTETFRRPVAKAGSRPAASKATVAAVRESKRYKQRQAQLAKQRRKRT